MQGVRLSSSLHSYFLFLPICQVNKTAHLLVTPRVRREVRRHFKCSSLEGGELEDQGDLGTAMTH